MLAWPPSCSPGLWGNCWRPRSLLPLSVSVLCESKSTQWKQLHTKHLNAWMSGLYHFLPLQPFFRLLPLGHLRPAVVVVFLSGWADVLRPIIARFVGLRWREQENQANQSEINSTCLRVFKSDARPCNKTWNGPDIIGGWAYGSAVASLFSKLEIFKVRNVRQFKPQRCKYSFISISESEWNWKHLLQHLH